MIYSLSVRIWRWITAAASCLWLITLGLRNPKNRHLLNQVNWHFGWGLDNRPNPDALRLPTRDLSEFVEEVPVQYVEGESVDGNVSAYELYVILSLLKSTPAEGVFEIGTFDGRTTLNLSLNVSPDATVHTLDLPREGLDSTQLRLNEGEKEFVDKDQSGSRFTQKEASTWPTKSQITQHLGDSATFDFSPYHGSCDLVFVDGSHTYDYVKSDTVRCLPLLKGPGSLMVWHDYAAGWEGVARALEELSDLNPDAELFHIKGTSIVVFRQGQNPLVLWQC